LSKVLSQARKLVHDRRIWSWLILLVSLLGLALRVEHALTFDQVHRASDYDVHLLGVRWMEQHWRPFFHSGSVNYQVRSYPPLWYFLSALILKLHDNERLLVVLSLFGWSARHWVLWRILRQSIRHQPIAQLAALSIHALLPLSVLIDGKVNPEGMHSGIFALALYALWLVERQSQTPSGVSPVTAATFGALAGVALLAKITGGLFLVIAPAVFGVQAVRWLRRDGLAEAWQKVGLPALAAGGAWLIVAGWWSGTNLVRFKHPFPHVWDLEGPKDNPILVDPALYRRPLGWALPFEWKDYWHFPILRNTTEPRPNFWATEISGTWSDIYNRGFCRLKGEGITDRVWGGRHGFLDQHSDVWAVSLRCVDWFATMVHVGVWITAAAVVALLWCFWRHLRTSGAQGSLGLPLVPVLCTASGMWFALAHPYDNIAALNPRYLLSQVMPMAACLGFGLAQLEAASGRRQASAPLKKLALWAVLGLIAVIGCMLVYERFGV
jgi:hypothetical protein